MLAPSPRTADEGWLVMNPQLCFCTTAPAPRPPYTRLSRWGSPPSSVRSPPSAGG